MNYEVVELKEMTVAGPAAVTRNDSPEMTMIIGGLWQKFYSGIAQKMSGRKNGRTVGLYCDYKENGEYTVLAGCEIDPAAKNQVTSENDSISVKVIPGGRYAKFTVNGDVQKAVGEAWGAIWSLPLERTFTGDFEEYMEECEKGSGTINIYIEIK